MEPTSQDVPQGQGDLQFDRAEYAGGGEPESFECAFCGTPLHSSYYQLNDKPACEACRYKEEQELQVRPGVSGFFKAAIAGALAGLVGALLYWGVRELTDYDIALIAIVVGVMVGYAVRWGVKAKGGWGYQVLAVFITYMAIASTFLPAIFQGIQESEGEAATEAGGAPSAVPAAAAPEKAAAPVRADAAALPATAEGQVDLSGADIALGLAGILFIIAATPVFVSMESPLMIVIIGVGLWEAWKIPKRAKLEITGPFQVGKVPEPPPAPIG